MDINAIRDKINKLLALSESPNENEARAALLKAHALMAEYKVTEAELTTDMNEEIVTIRTGVESTKTKTPWMIKLSQVIADAYCVHAIGYREQGARKTDVGFVGFKSDAEMASEAFKYTTRFLCTEISKRDRFYSSRRMSADMKRPRLMGYAYGFVEGLREALATQTEENGWGLVLTTPPEVKDYVEEHYQTTKYHSKAANRLSSDAFADGVKDGRAFDATNSRIKIGVGA